MHADTPIDSLVRNLRSAGLRPSDKLIGQILAHGDDAVAPLLELALDAERLGQEEPASLGPLHALRLLGELRPLRAAELILRKLPLTDDLPETQAVYLWQQEAPQIVGRLGADVLPIVLAIVDDESADVHQRGAAIETLGYLSATTPELRGEIVQQLRTRFEQSDNPTLRAYMVETLSELGAKELYAPIMAGFRDGTIDRSVVTAAEVRQRLLGSRETRGIDCANHTLDERYEQHGPYSEEQRRAMAEMQRMMGGY